MNFEKQELLDLNVILRFASGNDTYVHDPDHKLGRADLPAGQDWHKTDKGWSAGEGSETDEKFSDEDHRKMVDRLYNHVSDKKVLKKWLASDMTRFQKYLLYTPKMGYGQYYALNIPLGVQPPKEGEKLILDGEKVVVHTVETPEDIYKGKGGPVAKQMERKGIAFSVNCLPEGHEWLKPRE